MSEQQDWRLQAELDGGELDSLLQRVRGHGVENDVRAAVAHDVVITHDGRLLFAYAGSPSALSAARSAIERALQADGETPRIVVSHWNRDLDEWQRIDPPPATVPGPDAAARDEREVTTRTLVCTAGKFVRETFEQSLLQRAQELGVQCSIVEHPHLLTTQVAFTVTGTRRKLDEFRDGLEAEELATIRADSLLMNPL